MLKPCNFAEISLESNIKIMRDNCGCESVMTCERWFLQLVDALSEGIDTHMRQKMIDASLAPDKYGWVSISGEDATWLLDNINESFQPTPKQ